MTETITYPAVPSKYDIIPLHTSDRATFKECRRKWYWSSPANMNLVPKTTVYGVYMPFLFGTAIHHALEKFYHPVLHEDPESAFDAYWDLQWNGGPVHEYELDQFADHKPEFKDGVWTVRGLSEILPDPDYEQWENHHQIGLGMMKFYKEFAEREDDFTVVSTEHTFSVPVMTPDGEPLLMTDTRVMPEGYEQNEVKEVHARGRMDLIVQGNNTGNYVIIDHKTTERAIDEDYFRHTDLDEQVTTYIWAAEMEAKLYGLPYTEISGIVYQALRKAYPSPPTITTRGVPSLNRQTETTTAYLFDQTIKELGLTNLFLADDKMQAYYTYLVELGDKQFIWRKDVPRNKAQKENAGLRIYMEAMDMLGDPYIYPNPTKNWTCLNCPFRQPCIAVESGYDYESMIADGYESNHDR